MTARDRFVALLVGAIVLLVALWIMLVSPENKQAAKAQNELNTASSAVSSAEGQLSNARAAQARYAAAYASVVRLGKAVPPGREVPSLVYELARATDVKHVDFSSIAYGTSAGGTGPSSSSPSSGAAGASATPVAGFTQMPFTFVFNGTFNDLYDLFGALNHFTFRTSSGGLQVNGRLLTIQSVKLAPVDTGTTAATHVREELTGTVTATAYVLPASQALTAGGTPSAPAAPSAPSASSSSSGSSAPAAATITGVHP